MVHLFSPLVTGHVKVAILPRFPISGFTFILGNDLAGGNVFPLPEVITDPISSASACCLNSETSEALSSVFPLCAITRAQAQKMSETVNISDSFLTTLVEGDLSCSVPPNTENKNVKCANETAISPADSELCLNVTKEMLITAQKSDPVSNCVFFLCGSL